MTGKYLFYTYMISRKFMSFHQNRDRVFLRWEWRGRVYPSAYFLHGDRRQIIYNLEERDKIEYNEDFSIIVSKVEWYGCPDSKIMKSGDPSTANKRHVFTDSEEKINTTYLTKIIER